MPGIWNHVITETPVAVIDFETTGMFAGPDRVVEAAIVRIDPGCAPQVAFDSLIHPQRRMAATFVHGITDNDVADAPTFDQIADQFAEALAGCVVAAYNVYFDAKFLHHELSRVGICQLLPHLCLMYLRPLLDLGRVTKLADACRRHRVSLNGAHTAAGDALAAAELWRCYGSQFANLGLKTFADLANRRSYKFTHSFRHDPLPSRGNSNRANVKSRYNSIADRGTLWEALSHSM